MDAKKTKVFTYIGFAKKSGNLRVGANSIETLRKRVYLVMLCRTASDNARATAEKFSRTFGCPLYDSGEYTLEELTLKEDCKTAAKLAEAIIAVAPAYGLKLLSGDRKG
mgnify:CR=1 FL=1